MITEQHTQKLMFSAVVNKGAKEIFTLLLNRQRAVAEMDYNRRSGRLIDGLSTDIVSYDPDLFDGIDITINYPSTMRFLDYRTKAQKRMAGKTKSGKRIYTKDIQYKSYYEPIYNKLIFGHIYGRGYSLSNIVNYALNQDIQNLTGRLKMVKNIGL